MSDTALDAAARALARRLLRDLPPDRPRTRADVDRLPSPVARLLHAHLDAQAAEATSVPASPYVDPEADGVRAATRTWREAVRDAVRMPADVWAPAVEDAARRAVTHLIRPAETLAAHAFEGEAGPLDATAALDRTRAFGPYGYLPEIAGRYVERKEIGRIDRYGLELLLRRIDRRMVSSFGPDEWAELLAPLVALVGPDGDPEGMIPSALIETLFREKDVRPSMPLPEAVTEKRLHAWLQDVFVTMPPEPESPPGPALSEVDPSSAAGESSPPAATASEPKAAPGDTEATSDRDPDDAALLEHFGVTLPERDTDASTPERAPGAERPEAADDVPPAPPVIGSRFNDPADAPVLDSDVIGPARAVEAKPADDTSPPEVPVIFPHVPGEEKATLEPVRADESPTPAPDESPSEPTAPSGGSALGDDEEEPLWKRLAREQRPEPASPEGPAPGTDPDPLWKRFATPADDAEGPPVTPDITPLTALDALEGRVLGIGDDDRAAWFVADLFRGLPAEYHRTLAALDACRSYTEATQVIEREIFRKHRINPYTDAAVAFVDAVQEQFTRQGRG
ncbi:MAG: hypothetical protein AAF845_04440 [Bacteroidota bacterium]